MAFISSSTLATTSQTNATSATAVVPAPTGISIGNTLVVCLYDATSSTATFTWTLSGWTFTDVLNPATGSGPMTVGIRTADASDTSAVSYSFAGTSTVAAGWWVAAAILNYTDLGASFTTTPSSVAGASSITCVAPSVSPAASNDLLVAFYGTFNGTAPTTTPAGMTARATATSAGNTSIIALDQKLTVSGATGTRTQTFAGGDLTVGGLVTINQTGAVPTVPLIRDFPIQRASRW